ncbi:MAG: family 16 glycosylhydrolase [Clostridia bacterium]|nr:family 16 glycosylhydrolase [Clostridia bacterium]
MKTAKRIISILICAAMLLPAALIPAAAADAAPLKALIGSAAQLLYTDGTSASRRQLKAAYDTAVSVAANESALTPELNAAYDLLSAAIERFTPVASPERAEIAGFAAWDAETVSSFTDTSGCAVFFDDTDASAPAVKVVTAGKETAYFSNAASDESVRSGSIFSEDITETAGLRFSLRLNDLSLAEKLSVSVGVRTEGTTRTYTVIDIPVRNGCVAIDWEFFTADYDAVGTGVDLADMNYIAFSFDGVKPGFIGWISDLHCFSEDILSSEHADYQEVRATAIVANKYYKIVDSATGLALAVTPAVTDTETMTSTGYENRLVNKQSGLEVVMAERADDACQEWQLYRLPDGTFRIINRDSSLALNAEYYVLYYKLGLDVMNLNDTKQDWKINRSSNGFKFVFSSNAYMNYTGGSLRASNVQQVWEVYECVRGEWNQVWNDEFDGDAVDRSKWTVYNTKNRGDTEPVYFRDNERNVRVTNGELVINSIKENYNGYPMTGAYLTTEGHFLMSYGKVEMRARLPVGYWIWPALWMMGANGNWPQQGEIDIMELVGGGVEDSKLYGTLHWLSDFTDSGREYVKGVEIYNKNKVSLGDDYHTYGLEWEHDQLRIYFDGMQYVSMNLNTDSMRWGFGDNPHYIILNTSIRGPGNNEIYDETAAESEFNIDYIRVFKRSDSVSTAVETLDFEPVEGVKTGSVIGDKGATKVAASPDGSSFSVIDREGRIIRHDAVNGTKLLSAETGIGPMYSLKYSPSGKYLAAGSRMSSIMIYKSADYSKSAYASAPGVYFEALEFSADESHIYAGGRNDNVTDGGLNNKYIYSFGTAAGTMRGKTYLGSDVRAISASGDGLFVAAGTSSGTIYILDAVSLEILRSVDMGATVRGVAFRPNSSQFVASDEKGDILVFDAATGETVMTVENPDCASIASVEISPDGSRLVTTSSDNNARLFDMGSGRLIALLDGFSQMTTAAKFSHDGSRIAVCSLDGTARIYDRSGGLLYVFKVTASSRKGTSLSDIAFSADGTSVLAVPIQQNECVYFWTLPKLSDKTQLYNAIIAAEDVNTAEYTESSVALLRDALEASNAVLRSSAVTPEEVSERVAAITGAKNRLVKLPGADTVLNGFDPWTPDEVSQMSTTKATLSLSSSSVSVTPNVKQSLCISASSTTAWKMYNTTADGDVAGRNPFGADLSNCDGISIWAKALTKDQNNGAVYIGYTGEEDSFLFSASLPVITTTGQYINIPFSDFTHVSGGETLDLTKLNTIGFSGKGAKGMFVFTELTAYTEPGSVPVVSGIEDGATYDITDADAPSASWDSGMAFLDGGYYEAGTPITEAGAHVLSVNNHGTETTVDFTIVDNTQEPVISGVYERQVFDIAAEESALPTWDVGTASLNGSAYDGAAVARVGEYTLTVTNKHKTASVFFIVVDTSENQQVLKRGDFDKDGEITVADALRALRIAAKLVVPTEEDLAIGDVDNDGGITVADALKILRAAAKLISEDSL